jgi:hypothetical protein
LQISEYFSKAAEQSWVDGQLYLGKQLLQISEYFSKAAERAGSTVSSTLVSN